MLSQDALTEAARHARRAAGLAAAQRSRSHGAAHLERHWLPEARCHLMVTHQRLGASLEQARALSAIFFAAARLPSQPWYAQFRAGRAAPLEAARPDGVLRACRATSTFDVGLGRPRAYRVLCAEVEVDPATRVVGLRSVDDGPELPEPAVPALLEPPSADVFHHDGAALHWHHVVVTPGVGLGPDWFDRGLLRILRSLGLDAQERATYRAEAEGLVAFVAETDLAAFCAAHDVAIVS